MRILVISPQVPVPAHSGGAIRVLNMLRVLSQTDEVDLLSFQPSDLSQQDKKLLEQCCHEVIFVRRQSQRRWVQVPRLIKKALSGVPFNTKYAESPEYHAMVRERSASGRYDAIFFEHTSSAVLRHSLAPDHGAVTILTLHNIEAVQVRRMAQLEPRLFEKFKWWLTWGPMRRWEPRMAAQFDRVVVMSEMDRRLLQQRAPRLDSIITPNGVDTCAYTPFPEEVKKRRVVLVGSLDYEPNIQAVRWFHQSVWPRLAAVWSDAEMVVVGQNPPPEIRQLHHPPAVSIHANVPEVQPYYQGALAAVVAVHSGGGTRLKILEAMALGIPVVSTPVGCEGLPVQHDHDILIADSDEAFARQLLDLERNPAQWQRLARQGRACVDQHFDWNQIFKDMRSKLFS